MEKFYNDIRILDFVRSHATVPSRACELFIYVCSRKITLKKYGKDQKQGSQLGSYYMGEMMQVTAVAMEWKGKNHKTYPLYMALNKTQSLFSKIAQKQKNIYMNMQLPQNRVSRLQH